MIDKIKNTYHEYPHTFWMLIIAVFIDHVGGALIYPFLSLFITDKFGVGMTQVGQIFAIFAIFGVFGNIIGGAMTDKFGRKTMIIFGLVVSALTSLLMGFVNEFTVFYFLTAVVGLFSNAGGPAQQAMVADLLPEKQRTEGFGVMRVVANLAVVIGPAIGGLLASRSYLYLFILDAVISTITAIFVFVVLPETKPETSEEHEEQSLGKTLAGYGIVLKDRLYIVYILISMLLTLAYMQMNNSLPVFLRDVHDIAPQGYGYLLSMNAAMVVVLQFWVTRRLNKYPPLLMMALGTLLVGVGLAMFGFTNLYAVFHRRHDHPDHRRNDLGAGWAGPGRPLCAGRHARPLHGPVWLRLDHSLCHWSPGRRRHHGQLQPQLGVVRLRHHLSSGCSGIYCHAPARRAPVRGTPSRQKNRPLRKLHRHWISEIPQRIDNKPIHTQSTYIENQVPPPLAGRGKVYYCVAGLQGKGFTA